MRTAKTLIVSGIFLIGLPSLAQAQWYMGADVGISYTSKAKVHDTPLNANLTTSYDQGMVGLGQVGYSFGQPKLEVEFGYRENDVHKVGGAQGGGDASVYSVMVNGIYDLLPSGKVHPFVGAGIGAADLNSNNVKQAGVRVYSGDDTQFAYQGIAGVGYDVSDNWMVKAQYRYLAAFDPTYTSAATGRKINVEYANQSVLVGLTYKFSAPKPMAVAQETSARVVAAPPAPPPPAVPVAAAEAPPAPAPIKNFLIFFDFDKSSLSPEGGGIVDQVAHGSGVTQITITGHTDLSGSEKYNMALSLRRANAVKKALVRKGVPADEIVVIGKGKSDPLVQTADGVREPQNRRVEIIPQ